MVYRQRQLCDSFGYCESPQGQAEPGLVLYLINTTLPRSWVWAHVLALEPHSSPPRFSIDHPTSLDPLPCYVAVLRGSRSFNGGPPLPSGNEGSAERSTWIEAFRQRIAQASNSSKWSRLHGDPQSRIWASLCCHESYSASGIST